MTDEESGDRAGDGQVNLAADILALTVIVRQLAGYVAASEGADNFKSRLADITDRAIKEIEKDEYAILFGNEAFRTRVKEETPAVIQAILTRVPIP